MEEITEERKKELQLLSLGKRVVLHDKPTFRKGAWSKSTVRLEKYKASQLQQAATVKSADDPKDLF